MRGILVMFETVLVGVIIAITLYKKDTVSPDYLRSISVTVDLPKSEGAGVAFTRKDSQGKDVTFIWTDAHVVTKDTTIQHAIYKLDQFFGVIYQESTEITEPIVQTNINIIKLGCTIEGISSPKVISFTNEVEVIKYSDKDTGEDLAILKVKGDYLNKNSVKFALNESPKYGEDLYVIGSPNEDDESICTAVVACPGRVNDGKLFDQITGFIHGGSSGGGAFLKRNGECIGLVRAVEKVGLNFIIPTRRMLQWARRENVEWALNPNVPMPTDEELKHLPLKDRPDTVDFRLPGRYVSPFDICNPE
jgi:hypothetical protein